MANDVGEIIEDDVGAKEIVKDPLWFKGMDLSLRPRQLRQRHGMGTEIGADIQDGKARFDQVPEEGDLALRVLTVEIEASANILVAGRVRHVAIAAPLNADHLLFSLLFSLPRSALPCFVALNIVIGKSPSSAASLVAGAYRKPLALLSNEDHLSLKPVLSSVCWVSALAQQADVPVHQETKCVPIRSSGPAILDYFP